jgi:hypothetical protein
MSTFKNAAVQTLETCSLEFQKVDKDISPLPFMRQMVRSMPSLMKIAVQYSECQCRPYAHKVVMEKMPYTRPISVSIQEMFVTKKKWMVNRRTANSRDTVIQV